MECDGEGKRFCCPWVFQTNTI